MYLYAQTCFAQQPENVLRLSCDGRSFSEQQGFNARPKSAEPFAASLVIRLDEGVAEPMGLEFLSRAFSGQTGRPYQLTISDAAVFWSNESRSKIDPSWQLPLLLLIGILEY
jgi:hypothetical protein